LEPRNLAAAKKARRTEAQAALRRESRAATQIAGSCGLEVLFVSPIVPD
jgi:hypothetical protein